MKRLRLLLLVILSLTTSLTAAKDLDLKKLTPKPDAWFSSDEGKTIIANVLSNQSSRGDWPKNTDNSATHFTGDRSKIQGTFDNSATVDEIRLLARAYRATKNESCRAAVVKGIDHILAAQYTNGGWPQSFPAKGYALHITLNDDTMVNLMNLVREVATSENFAFVEVARRTACTKAFDRGVACLLKCQVVVDGKKTVWCAQHDAVTLEPRPARTFEPVSLSGSESASVLLLLMSLETPSPEVINAIESGVRWFDAAKLKGIRQEVRNGDKVIVADKNAPPLWARFYRIGSNQPMFSGRDSVIKDSIAEIKPERRNGYAWYGNWGDKVERGYEKWTSRKARATNRANRTNP